MSPATALQPASPESRLIVALDGDTESNRRLVASLGDAVMFYKIGPVALLASGGSALLPTLLDRGKQVFLDLKIFDVPATVGKSVAAVARMAADGVRFVTVHGNGGIVSAAVAARGDADLGILAVTVLTSLATEEARRLYGLPLHVTLEDYVTSTVGGLLDCGCDGVIASPREVTRIRAAFPDKLLIVTPGIRQPSDETHDQRRVGTAYDSIRGGADYVVVGRSIAEDPDPAGKARLYVDEIRRALSDC